MLISKLAALAISLLLVLPLGMLGYQAADLSHSGEHWRHLLDTWLGEALLNTLLLTLLSGSGRPCSGRVWHG